MIRGSGLAFGAIVVMEVSGSGKSMVGALLAAALDCRFVEGDDFYSAGAIAKMRRGEPLTEVGSRSR